MGKYSLAGKACQLKVAKGGALANRLLPPATPKLPTVWQSVATNRSRIYRTAVWI